MPTFLHRWRTAEELEIWEPSATDEGGVVLTSPPVELPFACDHIVPSWAAATPPGSWIELRLRAHVEAGWTGDYRVAAWDTAAQQSRRGSFEGQADAQGSMHTDTLLLASPARAVQASVLLCGAGSARPQLRALALCCSNQVDMPAAGVFSGAALELALPHYSQYQYENGAVVCSPTALAMVLGYWHQHAGLDQLAAFTDSAAVPQRTMPGVYDPVYDGYGNWSFNSAYAASLGMEAYVTRLDSLVAVERWIAQGVPLVLSVAWEPGDLEGAAIPRSRGHLLVACGFTAQGDLISADPAGATASEVRRVYRRAQFAACWGRSGGVAYIIHPPGWGKKEGQGRVPLS